MPNLHFQLWKYFTKVFLDSQRDFYHISPLPIGFKGRPKRADQQVWALFNQLYLETNTVNVPACQTNLLHKNTGKITTVLYNNVMFSALCFNKLHDVVTYTKAG